MKKWTIIAALFFCFVLPPFYAFCDVDEASILAKVEARILVSDYEGADRELKSDDFNDIRRFNSLSDEVERVIDYCKAYSNFNKLASSKGKEADAIASYENLIKVYNALPENLRFSDNFINQLETSFTNAQKYITKQCGNEYRKIRVGMSLSRVQKCYGGELFLRGQVHTKFGTVSEYGRGNVYLYIKNGKVAAWGAY